MLAPSPKPHHIDYAVKKLQAFVEINRTLSPEAKLDAVDNFAAGAGIDPETYDHLIEKVTSIVDSPGGELGWAVIGVIIGLYTAERCWDEQAS